MYLFLDLKWFSTITKKILTSVEEDMEKLEPSDIAGGNVI